MNKHRCLSQKSLITVRKWLFEGGDTLSTSVYLPSSRFDQNSKAKINSNRTTKRKRLNDQKLFSQTTSMIDWFYQLIKNIFTVYEEHPRHHDDTDDTIRSTMTYSTGQSEHLKLRLSTTEPTLKWNENHSAFQRKVNSKVMVTTATSSSNLHASQSIVRCSSKFTQTRAHHQTPQSKTYPLYCFSIEDGQILPLQFSSAPASTAIPLVKKIVSYASHSPLSMDKEKCASPDLPNSSEVPLLTADFHSYPSYQPTIASIPSSHSNPTSLQTTDHFKEDHPRATNHHPSSSLPNTPTCYLDEQNCLVERHHSPQAKKSYLSVRHHSSETHAPEIVFAKSTCQLIKQAWSSSSTD